jgi:cytochrome c biogenesis protein
VQSRTIKVNDPLRLAKARIYLISHGYAPVVQYTDRYGNRETSITPFLTIDDNLTSTGVVEFPDANVNPATGRDRNQPAQVAFSGFFIPTADRAQPMNPASVYPAMNDPVLVVQPYRGDLGLAAGIPHSVYSLDADELASGRLVKVGSQPLRLVPGQSATLDDGTTVMFLGVRPWASFTVRYDPGEQVVLVGAVLLLIGLVIMLAGRRRRVFVRVTPVRDAAGRTVCSIGVAGLARSPYPGFDAEFEAMVALVEQAVEPAVATDRDLRTEGQ